MTGAVIRFTAGDVQRANRDWQCSCGPAALAAICGLTLDEVKPHFMPAFAGWTTPTRMLEALRRSGRKWHHRKSNAADGRLPWPSFGLARIQWHGPWTMPGASPRWAYVHTHWVGVSRLQLLDGTESPWDVCIWDVNQLGPPLDGDGWTPVAWWTSNIVPVLTAEIPRATGDWHVTHAIEVERVGG